VLTALNNLQDPVLLPDSKITVDRATIERHLMSSKTDPFNRSPLTLDAVKPNTALKVRGGRRLSFAADVAMQTQDHSLGGTLRIVIAPGFMHVQAKIDEWKAARRR
jgi:U-box domain